MKLIQISAIVLSVIFGLSANAENSLGSVRIQSLLDFNAILITEVDVVFVYDRELADTLGDTKGEWYGAKYNLLRAETEGLEVITTSIPQGFDSAIVNLPENSTSAIKVFASAYHEAQDTPIHDMTEFESGLIRIDEFGILVSGQ